MTKQSDRDWRQQVLNSAEAATTLPQAPTVVVTAPRSLSAAFPNPPSIDPTDLLPPAAAERLRRLRQRRIDAHRLVPEFSQISEASAARVDAANALKRLTNHPQDGGFNLPESDARVIAATSISTR
jgi:hypothetical protein